jgi:hypothetical protein
VYHHRTQHIKRFETPATHKRKLQVAVARFMQLEHHSGKILSEFAMYEFFTVFDTVLFELPH